MVAAVTAPTPGIVARRRMSSSRFVSAMISRSNWSIYFYKAPTWSASVVKAKRAAAGKRSSVVSRMIAINVATFTTPVAAMMPSSDNP